MMSLDQPGARLRLDAALDGLAVTFRGMTAHPDESNCECHWGSADDLAQLKVADPELDPDLLQRTWQAIDWRDHASVLRRVLPQCASALVSGLIRNLFGTEEVGRSFALGHWQQWPAEQATAVEEFLQAWWACALTDPDPPIPVHDLLVLSAEATGTLSPWLNTWQALSDPVADRHLTEAAAHWEYELLSDQLSWRAWENEEEMRAELTAWLVRHTPARLRAYGAPEDLLHRTRPLGGPALARPPLLIHHTPPGRYLPTYPGTWAQTGRVTRSATEPSYVTVHTARPAVPGCSMRTPRSPPRESTSASAQRAASFTGCASAALPHPGRWRRRHARSAR